MFWDLLPLLNPGRRYRQRYGQFPFPTRRVAWGHRVGWFLRWLRELPSEIRHGIAVQRQYADANGDPRAGGGAVIRWERNKWVIRPVRGFRSLRWTPALRRTRRFGADDDDGPLDWADQIIAGYHRRHATHR